MSRRRIEATRPNECFGCGVDNPSGLHLTFFETEEGVETEYVPPAHLRGAPGVVHGGIQATILDEVMCMAGYAKRGTHVLTGELTIRYLKPVETDKPLIARARIAEDRGSNAFIEATILDVGGNELTRARGRFFFKT